MANTFVNAQNSDIPTVLTTIYTAPAATQSVIHAIYLANISTTTAAGVTMEIERGLLDKALIANSVSVPINAAISLSKPVNLEAGHKINAKSDVAGTASIFLSVLEIA